MASGSETAFELSDYIEWMLPCSVISLTSLPALSLPVGTTLDGTLPIGVQLVGRPGGEAQLLVAAAVLERALADADRDASASTGQPTSAAPLPIEPRPGSLSGAVSSAGSFGWSGPCTTDEAAAHLARAPPAEKALTRRSPAFARR